MAPTGYSIHRVPCQAGIRLAVVVSEEFLRFESCSIDCAVNALMHHVYVRYVMAAQACCLPKMLMVSPLGGGGDRLMA